MPVQQIVANASAAAITPHRPTSPPVAPKKTQPMPKIAVGRKVSTARTPSRDNQDDRHCERARQLLSGRPRPENGKSAKPAPRGGGKKTVESAGRIRVPLDCFSSTPRQPIC